MKNYICHLVVVWTGLLWGMVGTAIGASSTVRFAGIFSDHIVLLCEQQPPVWVVSQVGEEPTVHFIGQTKSTKAQANGRWQITLDRMPISGETRDMALTLAGGKTVSTMPAD